MMKKRRLPVIIALLLLYFMLNYIPKYSTAKSMFEHECTATLTDNATGLNYNVFSDGIYVHDTYYCCIIHDGEIIDFKEWRKIEGTGGDLSMFEDNYNHRVRFDEKVKEFSEDFGGK